MRPSSPPKMEAYTNPQNAGAGVSYPGIVPPVTMNSDFNNGLWPNTHYPGSELDFPNMNSGAAAGLNSVAQYRVQPQHQPQNSFYGQEFYDLGGQGGQSGFQNMAPHYGGGVENNLMGMPAPPSYPGTPSPQNQLPTPQSWPNAPTPPLGAASVPAPHYSIPTKIEPPPTPGPPTSSVEATVSGYPMTGYPGMPDSVVNAMNAAVPSAAMTTPGGVDPFDPFAIEQPSSTADNTISGPGMGNNNALGPRGSGPRASQGKGGGRGVAKGSGVNKRRKAGTGEDTLHPEVRFAKEKERRVSNNTRERIRIRDINEALTELGRVVMTLRPKAADKPQTKLAVLNMAVDVITGLERKVRDRNLNPAALALNRGPSGPYAGGHGAPSTSTSMTSSATTSMMNSSSSEMGK